MSNTMENWIVCAEVTDAAREVIEANGGKIEVVRKERPRLLLVTVVEALYHGCHREDGYFRYELSRRDGGRGGSGGGICWWNDDPIALTIYRWNGTTPDDPRLQHEGFLLRDEGRIQDDEREDWQ